MKKYLFPMLLSLMTMFYCSGSRALKPVEDYVSVRKILTEFGKDSSDIWEIRAKGCDLYSDSLVGTLVRVPPDMTLTEKDTSRTNRELIMKIGDREFEGEIYSAKGKVFLLDVDGPDRYDPKSPQYYIDLLSEDNFISEQ